VRSITFFFISAIFLVACTLQEPFSFSGDVPGGVIGVMRDGELIFSEAYGMANLTHGIPYTTSTLSNIGSVSKQFTAFAILLLEQQGKLSHINLSR